MEFQTGQVNAVAVSGRVDQILQWQRSGKVHSVFDSGFNLLFGRRLIHVGVCANGMAPFGIGLDHQAFRNLRRSIQQTEKVIWNSVAHVFVFASGVSLSLMHANRTDHLLQSKPFDERVLINNMHVAVNKMLTENWQTGLTQTEEEHQLFMRYMQTSLSSQQLPFIGRLKELASLANGSKKIVSEHVLDYWIGRGLGLTPSGDDIITGMCAMMAILGELSIFHKQLHYYLYRKGMERTTPVGYEYLWYASEKQYHTHLLDMCNAMLESDGQGMMAALQAMKTIGHTSGADTVTGILLGVKSWQLV
ncbi:hypothetical protein GCM10007063_18640 [Lentibacillus kapialis]|uniref:DUF2877 domain-containing protein n=1 Tax=Lentibacillus kapialis TaxID=340214 RepID=A0A917UYH6_9BACI|nr:DUF2877 domain-containing protein [Lentibacillus kapialis]GGJ96501.1 hypothetical protein GCM10007063_18640 [Lentibacillus kapialis]